VLVLAAADSVAVTAGVLPVAGAGRRMPPWRSSSASASLAIIAAVALAVSLVTVLLGWKLEILAARSIAPDPARVAAVVAVGSPRRVPASGAPCCPGSGAAPAAP